MARKTVILSFVSVLFIVAACLAVPMTKDSEIFLKQQTEKPDAAPITESTESQDTQPSDTIPPTTPTDPITTAKYKIVWDNEKCYLRPTDEGAAASTTAGNYYILVPFPKFSSVAAMKHKVTTGDLTEAEINALTKYGKTTGSGTELYNLNKLYDLKLPEELRVSYVTLFGDYYAFQLNKYDAEITIADEKSFQYQFDQFYNKPAGFREFISEEIIEDRNASVTYSRLSTDSVYKTVRYTVDTEAGILYVMEIYQLASVQDPGSGVPYRVNLYGVEHGQYYYGTLFDLEERPSLEWLASFGLQPYVEAEAS